MIQNSSDDPPSGEDHGNAEISWDFDFLVGASTRFGRSVRFNRRVHIYPCIMRTFFSQILPPKSRCALYTEPFVFMLGNLYNNTKSAKSNSFQFYATRRNKSSQKACLALYITSVHVRQWHQSCNLFSITIENLLHFLEYFDDKVNSMKNFPLGFVEVRSTHIFFVFLNKCGKIWKRKIFFAAPSWILSRGSKSSSRTPRS